MSNTIMILLGVLFCVGLMLVMLRILWQQQGRLDGLDRRFENREAYQELERQFGRTLDQSLGGLGQRMNDSLARQSTETAQNLGILREKLGAIDAAQQQFRDLGQHVIDLKNILGNRQARGAIGEVQLENLFKQVLPNEFYRLQVQLSNNSRADGMICMPNPPGKVVVDAKFPLEGYREWLNTSEKASQEGSLKRFAQDVKKHIDSIADKYILLGETADFALMFIPAEAVYAEIFASLPNIVEHSFKRKVFLVSPTTMMATLSTVRAIVRDVHMQNHAKEVQRLVGLVAGDVERLDERVSKLQSHFDQAQKDVREVRISASQITSRAEKISQVGLQAEDRS